MTEGNGIRIQSPGGVVIQAEGVQFKNQNGQTVVPPGLKGQKVRRCVLQKAAET